MKIPKVGVKGVFEGVKFVSEIKWAEVRNVSKQSETTTTTSHPVCVCVHYLLARNVKPNLG